MKIETNGMGYCKHRIPGLVLTEKGTLLGYYECRDSGSDWANIDIKVIRSTDGGTTWEIVLLIHEECEETCTLNNPVMVVDGEMLHFLYCKNYKQLMYCKSVDDGLTFTTPVDKSVTFETAGFYYNVAAIGPGHGIMHEGNILIPTWFAYSRRNPHDHRPSFISTICSKDHGETFSVGEIIGKDFFCDPSECALAVTADGKILNSIRNENPERKRGLAISENGYENWKDIHFEDNLPDPICMGSMTCRDGKIYHINCESTTDRVNLTVKISVDNFKTYESIFIDENAGYSDIAISEDAIYVLYEGLRGLYFKKIYR